MSARRCSPCSISYPEEPYARFTKCHVCGESTSYISNDTEDEDWARKVEYRLAREEAAERASELIPRAEGTLCIYEDDGRFFTDQADLIRAGIRRSHEHSLWLFRANGHIWEAQGWNESKRRWWIETVALDTDVPAEAVPASA